MQPGALARGGRGADRPLHVGGLDVLAGDRGDDRGHEPLAQPPLGVGVLGGPRPAGRVPGGGEVPGDQVRAGPLQVRRVGHQPLGDLLQPGRQPVLGRRLALPPRAVLLPHCPPPAALLPRRVHRDPALQLNHHTTVAAGGRAGISAQQGAGPCRAARSRPAASKAAGSLGPGADQLWVFCGDLGLRAGASGTMACLLFLASSQVKRAAQLLTSRWAGKR